MTAAVQFLRLDDVARRVGCCEGKIYVAMKQDGFPRPVKVFGKRAVAWVASEVEAWMNARIAERDAASAR